MKLHMCMRKLMLPVWPSQRPCVAGILFPPPPRFSEAAVGFMVSLSRSDPPAKPPNDPGVTPCDRPLASGSCLSQFHT